MVHPFNFAWGVDDDMLEALVVMLASPEEDVEAGAEDATPLPPLIRELCPTCTSADVWALAMAAWVRVMWDEPVNLFHPEDRQHMCTCSNLLVLDTTPWFYNPERAFPYY